MQKKNAHTACTMFPWQQLTLSVEEQINREQSPLNIHHKQQKITPNCQVTVGHLLPSGKTQVCYTLNSHSNLCIATFYQY